MKTENEFEICIDCGSDNVSVATNDELLFGCPECDCSGDFWGAKFKGDNVVCPDCGHKDLMFGYDNSQFFYCYDCDAQATIYVGEWIEE